MGSLESGGLFFGRPAIQAFKSIVGPIRIQTLEKASSRCAHGGNLTPDSVLEKAGLAVVKGGSIKPTGDVGLNEKCAVEGR